MRSASTARVVAALLLAACVANEQREPIRTDTLTVLYLGDENVLGLMPVRGKWSGMSFFAEGSPIGYENPRAYALLREAEAVPNPSDRDSLLEECG